MADIEMTIAELRTWLRAWVAETTGLPPEQISDDRPLDEYGLSSRDAVALSGELEDLTGRVLDPTAAYQNPSIAALATYVIEGPADGSVEESFESFLGSEMETSIAVVGVATRFPGGADSPEALWRLLIEGRDATGPLPEGRWEEFLGDPEIARLLAQTPTRGGYLDDEHVKGFDAEFFAISPREAAMTDPQQRVALELTWEALENARIPASDLRGAPVGVFIGSSNNDYGLLVASDSATAHPYAITGTASSIIPNRVSYFFDFRGPSVSIDTACSSSLVAVHQAVSALRLGQASVAVAGGVNMLLAPAATVGFGMAEGVLTEDGRIKAFADSADGISRAEGAGMVVLKRLSDAQRDGDEILAVIEGSAVNSDGHSNGLTAPNPDAQANVLRRAYADAGVDTKDVDYIEAHGTGTLLGDPIEATALGRVLGAGRDAERPTLLGSAKTNFGHMESAAGILGLIKVVLAMRNDEIPPQLNFDAPNRFIDFDLARLSVVTEPTEWPRYSGRAIAGVSGFGFGGTNAHVVLAEAPELPERPAPLVAPAAEPMLLPVSAMSPSRRRRAASDLADWLESKDGSTARLADVARTLSRRNAGRSAAVVTAADHAGAVAGLRALAAGRPAPGVFTADSPAAQGAVWVFSGFGAQHRKMGKELYLADPVFADALDEVNELILDESGHDVVSMFLDDEVAYGVETAQIGIFAIQVALVMTLGHAGLRPAAVVGHSMGEVAASWAAGGLSLADAVRVICVRSRLMGEGEQQIAAEDEGAMALVEYSAAEVDALIGQRPDVFAGVEPSVYAAPTHTTVGGPRRAVEAVVALAEEQGRMGRLLEVRGAGHTSAIDPILGELTAELFDVEARPLRCPLYSSVDKSTVHRPGSVVHGVDYWVKCTRHAVWFTQAIAKAVEDGRTGFIELAPNPVALMSVAATVYGMGVTDPLLVHTLKRKESEPESLLAAIAQLHVHGEHADLASLLPSGGYADVPGTAFLRKIHWADARAGGGSGEGRVPGAHVATPDGRHAWQVRADVVGSAHELVETAASSVLADVTVTAVETLGAFPGDGLLTTTLTRHPGGASLEVHAHRDGGFDLVAQALVAAGAPLPAYVPPARTARAGIGDFRDEQVIPEGVARWTPESGESVEDRLAAIVAAAMSYAVEDLPREVPLMDLGLDSLIAVRIKNRVEYEFDIPELQLQAVRDASLVDVARLIGYAVENREAITDLARRQAAGEDITAEMAAMRAAEEAATGLPSGVIPSGAAVTAAPEGTDAPPAGTPTPETPAPETPAPEAAAAATPEAAAPAGPQVGPRDASERLVFGVWAVITGASAGSVLADLPAIDDATAGRLAERFTERCGAEITPEQVRGARTIEALADVVRQYLETEVDGLVRTLRARPEGSTRTPVFVFNPAGGSTVVYEPLVSHLPADVPVYGLERIEGTLAERAAEYVPLIEELAGDAKPVLAGWSFGGAMAYEVASLLAERGREVALIGLLDTVRPSVPVPNTPEEMHARWERYAAFASKTYGFDFDVPHELLDAQGEEGLLELLGDMLGEIDPSEHGLSAAVIEHQRASFVDNRILETIDFSHWTGVRAPVVLYRAERMHDGAIELEPRYADIAPDGGWGELVPDLDIVRLSGDHLAVIDEPEIGRVGGDLASRLAAIDGGNGENR